MVYFALLKRITLRAEAIRSLEVEALPAADRLEQVEELTAHELRAHRVGGMPAPGRLSAGRPQVAYSRRTT